MRVATTVHRACWVTVGGLSGTCLNGFDGISVNPVGWRDQNTLLISIGRLPQGTLGLWQLDTDVVDTISGEMDGLRDMSVSPDGAWLAIKLEDSRPRETAVSIMPVGRSDLSRTIAGRQDDWSAVRFGWIKDPTRGTYLDSVVLFAPAAGVPVTAPLLLAARGYDSRGEVAVPNSLEFLSSDSTVATIDSSGLLTPNGVGETTVIATAGGWRSDTATITVVEPSSTTVLSEMWDENYFARWQPYGTPKPSLRSRNGVDAISTNGDGSYDSGAYSEEGFDGSRGLGIEINASTPTVGILRQNVRISMVQLDTSALNNWDHATGFPPGRPSGFAGDICGFAYPGRDGQGVEGLQKGWMAGTSDFVLGGELNLHTGRWYTITLQLFPDLSCGLAIDGVPVARSTGNASTELPSHIMMWGTALDDGILLGPLDVWEGVRGDIDWRVLGEGW